MDLSILYINGLGAIMFFTLSYLSVWNADKARKNYMDRCTKDTRFDMRLALYKSPFWRLIANLQGLTFAGIGLYLIVSGIIYCVE